MQHRSPTRLTRLRPRRAAQFVLILAVLLGTAACGSSRGVVKRPSATPSVYAMHHPTIEPNTHGTNPDSFYLPATLRVHVGDTIIWTNNDSDPHDITSRTGLFSSGPLPDGGKWAWRPLKAGRYPYFCTFHPEMYGVIIVAP